MNSYNTGLQTTEYVQAVTDCEVLNILAMSDPWITLKLKVLILSKQAMENLSRIIIVWDGIISKITAKAFAEKISRVSLMMPQDATTRYEHFLEKFPNLTNRIPLQYIASYIGVTKFSLSRLRRDISKKK